MNKMNYSLLVGLRRTPHGVRGLKFRRCRRLGARALSHPTRGAWIEIEGDREARQVRICRTPHGVRGLKFLPFRPNCHAASRTPHGVRGLKFLLKVAHLLLQGSHPTRGAWIEIAARRRQGRPPCGRTPHGVRGLKSVLLKAPYQGLAESHPTRGAWIEIVYRGAQG